jgi:hypothetical protein
MREAVDTDADVFEHEMQIEFYADESGQANSRTTLPIQEFQFQVGKWMHRFHVQLSYSPPAESGVIRLTSRVRPKGDPQRWISQEYRIPVEVAVDSDRPA